MEPQSLIERALEIPNAPAVPRRVAEALAARMPVERLPAGSVVVREGDPSQSAWFVIEGTAEVRVSGGSAPRLQQPGDLIGEIGLLTASPRTATIVAATDLVLLRLDADVYDAVAQEEPALVDALRVLAAERLLRDQLRLGLARSLPGLEPAERDRLTATSRWRHLARGDVLVERGAPSGPLHLCLGGELLVFAPAEGGADRPVARLCRGDLVGAVTTLTGAPWAGTIRAASSAWVAELDRSTVGELLDSAPRAVRDLGRFALSNTRTAQGPPPFRARSIALLPVDEPEGFEEMAQELARALGPHGAVRVVGHADLVNAGVLRRDDPLTPTSLGTLRLRLWLEARREDCAHVVLLGGKAPDPWTRRLVHEVEHLLFVGADAPPTGASTLDLVGSLPPTGNDRSGASLVLLHPPERDLPRGTAAWLDGRPFEGWYHVRRGHRRDHERLARWLRGESVGLALSGGGARSLAHFGVARALREADVAVDLLAGTSAGSVAAALLSEDGAPESLAPRIQGAVTTFGAPWRSLDLPVLGLVHHRRARAALRDLVGDRRIEDSWIRLLVVTTDLSTRRRAVHDRGVLLDRLLASCVPPGVAPPVVLDGHLHCDGGVVENLPVRAAEEAGCARVLASSVGLGLSRDEHFEGHQGPWERLWELFSGRKGKYALPTLPETVVRAMGMASDLARARRSDRLDLLFEPPVGAFSVADFTRAEALADEGWRHARARLAERGVIAP